MTTKQSANVEWQPIACNVCGGNGKNPTDGTACKPCGGTGQDRKLVPTDLPSGNKPTAAPINLPGDETNKS
jgi:DnaJ-class molecular chaperone